MKRLLLLFLIASNAAVASPERTHDCATESTVVLAGVRELFAAYALGDAIQTARLTHPSLIRLFGGRVSFVETISTLIRAQKTQGFSVESWRLGTPSKTYQAGADLVCFVPGETIIKTSSGRFREIGYTIAVRDSGPSGHWQFLGSSGLRDRPALLWDLLPNLPREVQLPPNRIESEQ
jgi:hypothetical protein